MDRAGLRGDRGRRNRRLLQQFQWPVHSGRPDGNPEERGVATSLAGAGPSRDGHLRAPAADGFYFGANVFGPEKTRT